MTNSSDHERKTNYCIGFWLLQEEAGCSFMEARIYLRKERNETLADIASIYAMDISEIQAIEQSVNEKVSHVESTRALFHGYEPIYPDAEDILEW